MKSRKHYTGNPKKWTRGQFCHRDQVAAQAVMLHYQIDNAPVTSWPIATVSWHFQHPSPNHTQGTTKAGDTRPALISYLVTMCNGDTALEFPGRGWAVARA